MPPSRKPIVVVGSINLDLVARAPHIPAVGETILGSDFQMHPGGKGANQAVAVAKLCYPVQLIGALGSDPFAQQLREHLQASGVDIAAVSTVDGSSGVAIIVVSDSGENSIVVVPGANALVSPALLDTHANLIRDAGVVLAQLEIPLATIVHLAGLCVAANVPLILDPAPAQNLPPELLKQVTWFTPNETEAAFYITRKGAVPDPSDLETIAGELLAKGIAGVILKLGARGAFLAADPASNPATNPATPTGTHAIASFPVKPVDTTAAGDCFNGAFATALMLGQTPESSARFASAASAISVTRPGAQSSMPTLAEVEQLLHSQP